MTGLVLASSVGLVLAGPAGAVVGGLGAWSFHRVRLRRSDPPSMRLILLLLLVELRSGLSVLASLQEVSKILPEEGELLRVARIATVSGITTALGAAGPGLRPVVAQLARAQRTGGSLSSTVRTLLDQHLADERTARLAAARTLPVRLMVPLTLLMLPGLVLLLYAPSLLSMFTDLTGGF